MKRIWRVAAVGIAVIACAAVMGMAKTYAVYYDCSSGRETVLTIMNADAMETEYTLSLFSAIGIKIGEVVGTIAPYVSVEYAVSELLAPGWEADACGEPNRPKNKGRLALCRGGLATVEAEASLLIKVALLDGGGPGVATNVVQTVPTEREHDYYWYAVSYEETGSRCTRLSIANPHAEPITVSFSFYNEDGGLEGLLSAGPIDFESCTYNVSDYVDETEGVSGVIDIFSSWPIVVIVEYMDEEGTLLSMEQTPHFHYVLD